MNRGDLPFPTLLTVSGANSPYHVNRGQINTNDVVVNDGSMFVDPGRQASAIIVSSGRSLTINSGGVGSGSLNWIPAHHRATARGPVLVAQSTRSASLTLIGTYIVQ